MENKSKILHIFILFVLLFATLNNFYDLLTDNFPPKMNDFKPLYVATRVFLKGGNPYEDKSIKKEWQIIRKEEKLVDYEEPGFPNFPFVHPPATLVVLSPLGTIKWQIVKHIYFIFNLIITICSLLLIAKMGNILNSKKELWLLVLSFFSFKACILGLLFGQFFYFSFFFCIMAIYFDFKQKSFLASIFMALGLLKPTIGIPFILYLLIKKRYYIFIYSILMFIVLNLAVFVILSPSIFKSYIDITNQSLAPGGINDYSIQNKQFFDLTSINAIIFFITNSRTAVSIILTILSLFIFVFILLKREIFLKDSTYALIIFILCSLLFIYHRPYDSLMLSTIFIWLKPSELIDKIKWKIILILPVFLPITGLILRLKPYIPETVYYIMVLNIPISLSALLIILILLPYQEHVVSKITITPVGGPAEHTE
jgi:hypothetical protein